MVSRRDLKSLHEDAVIQGFGDHLNDQGSLLTVLTKPDPPEAMVEIDGKIHWIEVTDAFLDKGHAIGLTSGACDDVPNRPDSGRLIGEPDKKFRESLLSVIETKYDKNSMQSIASANGPGILLVGIFTPFNTARGVTSEEKSSIENLINKKQTKIFGQIYLYDGTGNREFHLVYQKT